jgi:hypothetical protein
MKKGDSAHLWRRTVSVRLTEARPASDLDCDSEIGLRPTAATPTRRLRGYFPTGGKRGEVSPEPASMVSVA